MFWNGLIKVVNLILQGILNIFGGILGFLINVFPTSPFVLLDKTGYSDFIAKINYFIPFYEFIAIMEAWLVCIAIYYLYSALARWVKMIE